MIETVDEIDPFACRMWDYHDRLEDYIDEDSCREVIESFLREGQKHPVLARVSKADGGKYELIYGARRLFAARHLNIRLLARIENLDDRQAFIEMDVENRLRCDISPYERGKSFTTWLRSGHFRTQEEIAKTLGLSTARVCRLMKFAELPAAVLGAFPDPRQIRERWAVELAERCANAESRKTLLSVARSLSQRTTGNTDAKCIYKLLIDGTTRRGQNARVRSTDDVVRGSRGQVLFRISYRHNNLHLVIARDLAPAATLTEAVNMLKTVLEGRTRQGVEPPESGDDLLESVSGERGEHLALNSVNGSGGLGSYNLKLADGPKCAIRACESPT